MADKNNGKKIAVAGCRDNTSDLIEFLVSEGYEVSLCMTLSEDNAKNNHHISGYTDPKPICDKYGIEVYYANDYLLRDGTDNENLLAKDIDVMIVLGWQKIIPKWLLGHIKIGAAGMHGSCKPLPFGRGHSVLNWSCIEGQEKFITNLFYYHERVDAGPIIGMYEFDINEHDTCETLHFKYRIGMKRILLQKLPDMLSETVDLIPQSKNGATYYPKRTPKDGLVFWNNKVGEVHNLIRGVAAPYPGALTYLDGKEIKIWRGHKFDSKITWNKKPGTIVDVFHNGKFVVQTRDYGYMVHEYEGFKADYSHIGKRFENE